MYRIPVEESFSWQRPIKSFQDTVPGGPAKGDRYILNAPDNRIATFIGATTSWIYDTPQLGWSLVNLSDFKKYIFNGVQWVAYGTILDITESIDDVDTRIADAIEQVLENAFVEYWDVPFLATDFAADVASGAIFTIDPTGIEFNRVTSYFSKIHHWNFRFTGTLDINANYISVILPKGLTVAVQKQTSLCKAADSINAQIVTDSRIDPTVFTNAIIHSKFSPFSQFNAGAVTIEGTFVFVSD